MKLHFFVTLGMLLDFWYLTKRRLLLGRKVMTNLNIIVTYGCESWTVKKAEHRRTDAFEMWFWRRLLRVP